MTKRDLHLLEGAALGALVVVIVGAFVLSSIGRFIIGSNQPAAVVAAVLVDLTNQNRQDNGLDDLSVSPLLVAAAQAKADDEAAKGYFAHVSPDGHDSWYWFQQAGYDFSYAGENLAVDFTDSDTVVNAWMNSPEHRANILDSHYTQIGIATAQGMYEGHPTIFVVQMFGTPATPASTGAAPVETTNVPSGPTQIATAQREEVAPPTPKPQVLGSEVQPKPAKVAASPTAQVPAQVIAPAAPLGAIVSHVPLWEFFALSPETTLRYVYYFVAFIILAALFLTTGVEFKRHHMRHVAVAVCLLVLMCGLFSVASVVVFGDPTIANAGVVSEG